MISKAVSVRGRGGKQQRHSMVVRTSPWWALSWMHMGAGRLCSALLFYDLCSLLCMQM